MSRVLPFLSGASRPFPERVPPPWGGAFPAAAQSLSDSLRPAALS
jgi:hypothetical protein